MRQTKTLSLILAAGVLATTAAAQGQRHSLLGPGMKAKPGPLGLAGTGSVPKNFYNYSATKKILDTQKQTSKAPGSVGFLAVGDKVNVFYDSTGVYGWLGDIYSVQMANLLGRFGVVINRLPVENYQAGMIAGAQSTFYLGLLYDNPLPASFKADVMSSTKNICWMGYNLWQVAWNADNSWNTNFLAKFGISFDFIDGTGYPTVNYGGQALAKLQYDPTQGKVTIQDSTKAKALATSSRPDGLTMPYITQAANLFYVADNPFSYTSYTKNNDRVLAFFDVMHEVLQTNAVVDHKAIVRIEDVSCIVPASTLRAIADTLAAEKVPFVVCVIPQFEDPLGAEFGTPTSRSMTKYTSFINALKYMESKGGKVIMHGYTHQYSNLPNPYNAESADDFEFFRMTLDANGNQVYGGPVPEDSATWAAGRLTKGLSLMKTSGFTPDGWVTPHYLASPVDYVEFNKKFAYSICRGIVFTQTPTGELRYAQQLSPWVYTDHVGMKRIPETVGYLDTDTYYGIPPRLVPDLLADVKANKVVRDGYAGMYFHWYLPTSMLRDSLRGIKAEGYTFVLPSATLK